MATTRIQGDVQFTGTVTAPGLQVPEDSVGDAQADAGDPLDRDKTIHELALDYQQAPGTDIATATLDLHIARAAGVIVDFEAAVTGVAATGDRSVTVDLQKGNAGSAFASVLTSVVTLDSGNALRTPETAAITTTAYANGDIYRIVVTQVAGTTGTRPQGLIVTLTLAQEP